MSVLCFEAGFMGRYMIIVDRYDILLLIVKLINVLTPIMVSNGVIFRSKFQNLLPGNVKTTKCKENL